MAGGRLTAQDAGRREARKAELGSLALAHVEEDRQVGHQLDAGDRIEGGDPANDELAGEGVDHVYALAEQRHEGVDVDVVRLRHHVLHQPIEQRHARLHLRVGVG